MTKRFPTLFIESIVANNFLEKNFEETAEKYFKDKFEIDILKIDFDHKQ